MMTKEEYESIIKKCIEGTCKPDTIIADPLIYKILVDGGEVTFRRIDWKDFYTK